MNNTNTEDFDQEEVQNQLNENERLLEAVRYLYENTHFVNYRRFRTYAGLSEKEGRFLQDIGLIRTYERNMPLLIMRSRQESFTLANDEDKAEQALEKSLEAIKGTDININFDPEEVELIEKLQDESEWLQEISERMRFEEGFGEDVESTEFGYPMFTWMSKGVTFTEEMKRFMEEQEYVFQNTDIETIRIMEDVFKDPKTGVYNSISSSTEGVFRVIYSELRDREDLDEYTVGELLLRLERDIYRSGVTLQSIREELDAIKSEREKVI